MIPLTPAPMTATLVLLLKGKVVCDEFGRESAADESSKCGEKVDDSELWNGPVGIAGLMVCSIVVQLSRTRTTTDGLVAEEDPGYWAVPEERMLG